jgi:hypothetical protein
MKQKNVVEEEYNYYWPVFAYEGYVDIHYYYECVGTKVEAERHCQVSINHPIVFDAKIPREGAVDVYLIIGVLYVDGRVEVVLKQKMRKKTLVLHMKGGSP